EIRLHPLPGLCKPWQGVRFSGGEGDDAASDMLCIRRGDGLEQLGPRHDVFEAQQPGNDFLCRGPVPALSRVLGSVLSAAAAATPPTNPLLVSGVARPGRVELERCFEQATTLHVHGDAVNDVARANVLPRLKA